ncbi:MAG TPA: ClC family H(+)/Cl(-) exchange transporter [Myxococcota bacterium]|nr:ClC family H(+)/Cl(-) exchange transporter [Myxococcota bacterium]
MLWLVILASGALVGALSVAFHLGLDAALGARERLTAWLHPMGPSGFLLLAAVCAAAVGGAVWLTDRFARQAAGSGIQHVEGVERGLLAVWPLSVLWVKFVAGVIGIGGGLLLGREGPTVQMGASLAEHLGSRLRLPLVSRRTLLVVGAGAGLTGAFNAPLAGTLFVVEEVCAPLRPPIYLGTLAAALVADLCVRRVLGQVAELDVPGGVAPSLGSLVPVLLLGALGGASGSLFNAGLLRALALADAWRRRRPGFVLGIVLGAVLAIVAWFVPDLPGGGVEFAARALDGGVSPRAALWLLPLAFALTLGSYAVGAPGGIFAPLLVIGALLGLLFHAGCLAIIPAWSAPMPVLAIAGMGALFAGIVRSPLTGAVLLVEMSGSYSLVLPLVAASLAAYAVAESLGIPPVYESLLERELERRSSGR